MVRNQRVVLGGLLASLVVAGAAGMALAAPDSRDGKPTVIYRCEGSGTISYSDTQQRCLGGEVRASKPAASAVQIGPVTARLSFSGPPCPMPVPDPEGPVWGGVRACYTQALAGQPSQRFSESHLAGVLMGQCEGETQKLAQARTFVQELGATPDARRQVLRRWAQWLVQQSGQAVDTMPVQAIVLGKAAAISRLSGPLEVQLPDGNLVEGFNGTLVQPGQQLHVRKGVSLLLGASVVAVTGRDRCVRLD